MVMKKVNGQTKDKMLPLQGPSLWHKWAKHDKERHRHEKKKQMLQIIMHKKMMRKGKLERNSYIIVQT